MTRFHSWHWCNQGTGRHRDLFSHCRLIKILVCCKVQMYMCSYYMPWRSVQRQLTMGFANIWALASFTNMNPRCSPQLWSEAAAVRPSERCQGRAVFLQPAVCMAKGLLPAAGVPAVRGAKQLHLQVGSHLLCQASLTKALAADTGDWLFQRDQIHGSDHCYYFLCIH